MEATLDSEVFENERWQQGKSNLDPCKRTQVVKGFIKKKLLKGLKSRLDTPV
jgi:hypothetical protein